MAGRLTRSQRRAIDGVRDRILPFDAIFGPAGDCGESTAFVTINDMRQILDAADPEWRKSR